MVIGDDFVYLALPKTGSDAVHQWFKELWVPGGKDEYHVDDTRQNYKHDNTAMRPIARGKKHVICSFRQLPEWTRSWLHAVSGPNRDVGHRWGWINTKNAELPHSALEFPYADYYLRVTCGHENVTHWLRQEHLIDDFISMFNKVVRPLSEAEMLRIRTMKTKGRGKYDHDVSNWLTFSEIRRLYALNPMWSKVETSLYFGTSSFIDVAQAADRLSTT